MNKEFPHAARMIGAHRVAGLGCSSALVGMLVPGLHSIFGGLMLNLVAGGGSTEDLGFLVTSVDPRFRRVQMEILGGGLSVD